MYRVVQNIAQLLITHNFEAVERIGEVVVIMIGIITMHNALVCLGREVFSLYESHEGTGELTQI